MKKKSVISPEIMNMSNDEIRSFEDDYRTMLNEDPKYSLEVDPTKEYNLGAQEKQFIKLFINYKDLGYVAGLMGIDIELARQIHLLTPVQAEIRRIGIALSQRQFSRKMMDLDEIGGFLTSQITGEFVPFADQLDGKGKLKAAELLIDLNVKKRESLVKPGAIYDVDFSEQLKDLSVNTISSLIQQSELISPSGEVDPPSSLPSPSPSSSSPSSSEPSIKETEEYLSSLSTEELLKIIDETSSPSPENTEEPSKPSESSKSPKKKSSKKTSKKTSKNS